MKVVHRLLALGLLALLACHDENTDAEVFHISAEAALCDAYERGCRGGTLEDQVLPYFRAHARTGELLGVDDVPIRYAVVEKADSVGSLVIVQGFAESYLKYVELIYDLRATKLDLYVIDHRGQGRSGRLLDDPQKGHVGDFHDFVTDLETFIDREVPTDKPAFAAAHSMGGAILALYVMDHPHRFDAVTFAAPMWELNFAEAHLNETLARAVAWAFYNEWFAIGEGPYDPDIAFEGNKFTASEPRFELTRRMFIDHPETQLGGPTYGWVAEAVDADREIRDRAAELVTPMQVLSAGRDRLVVPAMHRTICDRADSCTLVTFEDAQHELFTERDAIRSKAIATMLDFFDWYR